MSEEASENVSVVFENQDDSEVVESLRKVFESFASRDDDIECFLKEKAVRLDKSNYTRTYLLFHVQEDTPLILLGYFSLAIKNIFFSEGVSKSRVKDITGKKDSENSPFILLAQIGKNYSLNESYSKIRLSKENEITLGRFLLRSSMDTIYKIHELAGVRYTLLECNASEALERYYKSNGFIHLQDNKDNGLRNYIKKL